MMRRFLKRQSSQGQQPVLLYCGDFDPAGLLIADTMRANLAELSDAGAGSPDCPTTRPVRPDAPLPRPPRAHLD